MSDKPKNRLNPLRRKVLKWVGKNIGEEGKVTTRQYMLIFGVKRPTALNKMRHDAERCEDLSFITGSGSDTSYMRVID